MPKMQASCSFTGHRPHKLPWGRNEDDERCVATRKAMAGQIEALHRLRGVTDYYSGMADGTDLFAALAVLDLKEICPDIRLHCILPYPGQCDRWPEPARERYHAILDRADEAFTLSRHYYDGCLMARNKHLVDAAGYLLAVYDGTRGGTAATIAYARQLGRTVIVIDPVARVVRNPVRG